MASAEDMQEGMASLNPSCTPLKQKYDTCFNVWFKNSYLKGSNAGHDEACGDLFQFYQECLQVEKNSLTL